MSLHLPGLLRATERAIGEVPYLRQLNKHDVLRSSQNQRSTRLGIRHIGCTSRRSLPIRPGRRYSVLESILFGGDLTGDFTVELDGFQQRDVGNSLDLKLNLN